MLATYPDLAHPSPDGARCRRCQEDALLRRDGYDLCGECHALYMVTPVGEQAALMRTRSRRRPAVERPSPPATPVFPAGTLVLSERHAFWHGERVPLTSQRRALLTVLADAGHAWVERDEATRRIYGDVTLSHILSVEALVYGVRTRFPDLIVIGRSRQGPWDRMRITAPVQYEG